MLIFQWNALEQAMKTIEKNLDRMVSKEKINHDKENLNNISLHTNLNEGTQDTDLLLKQQKILI